jgi:hypothetical protein
MKMTERKSRQETGATSGNEFRFTKEGLAIFSKDDLIFVDGEEHRDLSKTNKVAQSLVKGIKNEFMADGWNFASIISFSYDYRKSEDKISGREGAGEFVAVIFTNPFRSEITERIGDRSDFIKEKWKGEIRKSFYPPEIILPEEPSKKLIENTGLCLSEQEGFFASYNQIIVKERKNFLSIKKDKTYFQKGVVVVWKVLPSVNTELKYEEGKVQGIEEKLSSAKDILANLQTYKTPNPTGLFFPPETFK